MSQDPIPRLMERIDPQRIAAGLTYLAKDPLPCRKLNYTLPGHDKSTLNEADDYIEAQLPAAAYTISKEGCPVQAFRRDRSKNIHHQYSTPDPADPWYTAYNLYAIKRGTTVPCEIVVVISHKDSQSWIDSPGAYDNAVGTVANMEIARALAQVPLQRTLCFLYCNEEHTPWTSVTAAKKARERGDDIVALFNIDGLGAKPQQDIDAKRRTCVARYLHPEGRPLAELVAQANEHYGLGLTQSIVQEQQPGDDHGSFIKEGYNAAIMLTGSSPYRDPNYHLESDTVDQVDIENVTLAARATLAAIVWTAGVLRE